MLVALIIVGAYLALLAIVAWKSVAPFRVPIFITPAQLGLPQESIEFGTSDGKELRGWLMPRDDPTAVAIFVHGYMMNRSELVAVAAMCWAKGCACLLFDLRGHGTSGGKKTGFGYWEREDVRAAVESMRARFPDVPVLIVGSSMGGAAAAFAVAEDRGLADALVLDSAYTRLDWAALGWWRFLGGKALMVVCAPTLLFSRIFLGFRLRDADVAAALERAAKPTLILHGRADRLALPFEAERNYASCNGPSRLVWFDGCNHSGGRYFRTDEYNAALFEWLAERGLVEDGTLLPVGNSAGVGMP